MTIQSFTSVLVRPEGVGTWTYLSIPLKLSATFGSKGQVKVKGTINAVPFRSTALPMGDGSHYLVVAKNLRDQIGATQGDAVNVMLELDIEERQVDIPEDLKQALDSHPQAQSFFASLSYSQEKIYIDWIMSARQEATRQRRIEKALLLLSQGKKLHG
jgi:Bacteriocin-protection, YdeI or OmpD-Associated/Domain of unknown function (DUF1905)